MPRPKEFGLLRPDDYTWLEHLRDRDKKHQPLSDSDRQRLFRLRERTEKVLKDLSYLADTLPEEQLNQILTPAKTTSLAYHLLGLEVKEKSERHFQLARSFVEWSFAILSLKLQTILESRILSQEFLRIKEYIELLVKDKGYYYESDKDTGKLIFKELKSESRMLS